MNIGDFIEIKNNEGFENVKKEREYFLKLILTTWEDTVGRSSMICGGAAVAFNLELKDYDDIDMYVESDGMTKAEIFKFAGALNADAVRVNSTYYNDLMFDSIHEIDLGGRTIQIIGGCNMPNVLSEFDIGLCQMGYSLRNGNLELTMSNECRDDINNKSLTAVLDHLSESRIETTLNSRLPKYVNRTGFKPIVKLYGREINFTKNSKNQL